ncbi:MULTISPECIES: biofilm peroxide resistance protein BsmA [Enterobacteriaceae]|uniref:biofilm peroxide resistance protein BsmA n=1 Tax=Enterobacteriaceae TaxID=543 RepID=UPI0003A8C03E|nr:MULTISPECIES: biofilm peroxide resistance protein BsmA [Enterobacteriaceae]ANR79837.1 bioflm peroxide resistance protein BsmA [Kosakonia sacchari]MCL6743707.1 biofilm peroxide resistance protein BsmA [Kosakonia sp. R1.Fl]MCZ3384767.1 biofilm peroxide resistance protein BsmA [Kosakonia sp. SOY2]PDO86559.1 biofilm peroxide resistance protein BsmA [Kosakonia sacchari]QHM96651.1 biofilm peroxide resistance protein BsmA [Kosakonia sacchari]
MAIRRDEKTMRALPCLLFALLLSGCAVLEGKPQSAPPVSDHPQEIRRNQTQDLREIGAVSVTVLGSPMDVEDAIKAKAVAAGANYYVIIMMDDTIIPGRWFGRALLYKQ